MTKQELIKILDEKIENAEKDLKKQYVKINTEQPIDIQLFGALRGEIQAYTDIKNLLENEVLEDE